MTTTCRIPWKTFLGVIVLTVAAAAARAGEEEAVKWRYDYNAARREAQDKGLPLVLDFGTEHCFWCKRLDATTFQDPAVVRLMNGRFIPLKVDAEKESGLANYLRVQSYPTIVIAASDGKIYGTHEGYLDASRFHEHLKRALAAVTNPEWMTRDYREASKAIAGSDFARAIALLRSVIEDGKDRPVQVKARQLLKDLEQQAAERLARAKKLNKRGQTSEAMETLTELLRVFGGTKAAAEAGQLLASLGNGQELQEKQRVRQARALLAQAHKDYDSKQYLCCIDRCELLTASYGDLPESDEARRLKKKIQDNPDWMQSACESLSERLGGLYLSLAESWLKKGKPQEAVLCLEKVVKSFPSSRQAEIAQARLAQIQARPPLQQQANYEDP
jgi:thioredoxin-like negative regulator of GroEL